MTEDHIFPQGMTPPGARIISNYLKESEKGRRKVPRSTRLAQNGLKKKTLCSRCNNNLLGAKLDPSLIAFCNEIDVHVRNKYLLPNQYFNLEGVKLNKVIRAVVGHLLAYDDSPKVRSPFLKVLRRYFWGQIKVFPTGYDVLFWLYPNNEQAVFRDIFIVDWAKVESMLWVSAYKAYPVGFAICQNSGGYKYPVQGFINLSSVLNDNEDQGYKIRISLNGLVPLRWPEAPASNGAILSSGNPGVQVNPYVKRISYPY
ncbi:hypothetical protein [Pseudomonas sp. R2-7-07]|uniref:hypothetical protein n=1 Tax=Pseudomonas sp. R2-7-07 TaxID=658641 RepID=UPI000F582F5C|nr:hypothetical protein [Pseudomonas sp. R2-7-07]